MAIADRVSLSVRTETLHIDLARMPVTAAVRDAAHNAVEVELAVLGVPNHIAAAILASTLVDHVCGAAFAAACAEVDVKLQLALAIEPSP